jgi:hypothetical protein
LIIDPLGLIDSPVSTKLLYMATMKVCVQCSHCANFSHLFYSKDQKAYYTEPASRRDNKKLKRMAPRPFNPRVETNVSPMNMTGKNPMDGITSAKSKPNKAMPTPAGVVEPATQNGSSSTFASHARSDDSVAAKQEVASAQGTDHAHDDHTQDARSDYSAAAQAQQQSHSSGGKGQHSTFLDYTGNAPLTELPTGHSTTSASMLTSTTSSIPAAKTPQNSLANPDAADVQPMNTLPTGPGRPAPAREKSHATIPARNALDEKAPHSVGELMDQNLPSTRREYGEGIPRIRKEAPFVRYFTAWVLIVLGMYAIYVIVGGRNVTSDVISAARKIGGVAEQMLGVGEAKAAEAAGHAKEMGGRLKGTKMNGAKGFVLK